MNSENELEKNINEIKEWQDHQFDPGYWTGGKIPPHAFRNQRKMSIIFLAMLIATLAIIFLL